MAGKGFAASGTRSRKRDEQVRDTVRSDGKLGGYDLRDLPKEYLPLKPKKEWADEDVPEHEDWHIATLTWWDNWRSSPQATRMLTDPDWDYLLDTALMHHRTWMSGGSNTERLAEIRIRVANFGATVADRARLRFEIEAPPEQHGPGRQSVGGNVIDMSDRRAALGG